LNKTNGKNIDFPILAELSRLPALCTTPVDHQDLVCINPFHYERVVSSSSSGLLLIDSLSTAPASGKTPSKIRTKNNFVKKTKN
jgi:hypothetical protein